MVENSVIAAIVTAVGVCAVIVAVEPLLSDISCSLCEGGHVCSAGIAATNKLA
jgi:hypothetical protein